MVFTADFETTTYLDENKSVRVWAYGLCEIGNTNNFMYGNCMDDFLEFCARKEDNDILYFHNLAFDGDFIISALLNSGFRHVKDRKEAESNTFTTLISNSGTLFYSIEIFFKKQGKHTNKVTIYDSLKIIPFPVEKVAKSFNLPISKLKINYKKKREVGYILKPDEVEYLKNDVTIMAMALHTMFSEGLDRMTQGSNALYDYKNIVGKKRFEQLFPIPDYDSDIRQSYKGGFTYVNPRYKNKIYGKGIVLDVNSLYPSVMRYKQLPYGEGKFFEGKYEPDKLYNLYVQMLTCQFELKPNHIPTLQLKGNGNFIPTEYVTSSKDTEGKEEERTLCLTSVDLDLFFEHYNVYNVEYISGWKFKSTNTLFEEYIDKWIARKIQAKLEHNDGMYTLSKLMLNALYGKFSLNPIVGSRTPYLDKNGVVKYAEGEEEYRKPIYIPIGTFVTSWARYITITSAQKMYENFAYADTDSLHLLCKGMTVEQLITKVEKVLEISDTELGKWKHELTFEKAKYIRQKCYIEYGYEPDKPNKKFTKVTCAGMTETCKGYVSFDNFNLGQSYKGKLAKKHVKGGIILEDTEFTIRRFKH